MFSRITLILVIIITALTFLAEPVLAYWVWTPQTKKWVNPKYAPKDTPKEQLLYAMDFYEAKDYKKALREFKKIIKYYKLSETASEAQFYIGRCYENMGHLYVAVEAYQKVIDKYPFTNRVDEIIERQFDIGEKLYSGDKTKFLGMSFKPMPEQIIDVYKKVVSNAPYSKYAPEAQYRIGELYKKLEFYEEAREAFQKIVEDYASSDMAPEAKFQVALCASTASGKSGYDQRLTNQAIEEFESFVRENPDSELAKKAKEQKKELKEKRAESYFKTARFYERTGKRKSAYIYYNKIVEEFKGSSVAPQALERIQVLEKRLNKKKKKE
ncbi:MAG: outer membrane protein assembly factor BamD [Candidatus Omnitrophica bacterium]|nr:outer membrane protein assembly factor BamD [Candidatus Omnitrophota bacterium]